MSVPLREREKKLFDWLPVSFPSYSLIRCWWRIIKRRNGSGHRSTIDDSADSDRVLGGRECAGRCKVPLNAGQSTIGGNKKSCCGRAGVRSASGKSQKERAAESGRVEKKTAAAAARGGQKRPQPQRIGKRIERRRRGSQCIFLLLLLAVHCSSSSGSCGACVSQPVCLCAC